MRNFFKGDQKWDYIYGVLSKPSNDQDEKYVYILDIWKANNSNILTLD